MILQLHEGKAPEEVKKRLRWTKGRNEFCVKYCYFVWR